MGQTSGKPRSIFVISPIGSPSTPEHRRYKLTLDYIIRKAFLAPEWDVVRADEEASPDSITTQVIGRIVESDLIIADLTDHNPNVFYELAVAHGYRKPVIHMMQRGQSVPFDVIDQRVIFYELEDPESVDIAKRGLVKAALYLDENPGQNRNPLSGYEQFQSIRGAGSEAGVGGEAIAEALSQLTSQVARLDNEMRERRETDGHLDVPARWTLGSKNTSPATLIWPAQQRKIMSKAEAIRLGFVSPTLDEDEPDA